MIVSKPLKDWDPGAFSIEISELSPCYLIKITKSIFLQWTPKNSPNAVLLTGTQFYGCLRVWNTHKRADGRQACQQREKRQNKVKGLIWLILTPVIWQRYYTWWKGHLTGVRRYDDYADRQVLVRNIVQLLWESIHSRGSKNNKQPALVQPSSLPSAFPYIRVFPWQSCERGFKVCFLYF